MKFRRHFAKFAFIAFVGAGVWFAKSQDDVDDVSQLLGERPVKDFVVHDDEFMIKGDQAFMQPNELVRLEGIVVETRREGEINLTIETPTSLYDQKRKNVRSSDSITILSADDQFLLSGDGFSLFPETQQVTILSNVLTRFDRRFFTGEDSGASLTNGESAQLIVNSRGFYFDGVSGAAEYRDGVRLSDGEGLTMDSGLLRLNVSDLTNEVREVRAIQNVVISLETTNGNAKARSHEVIMSTEPDVDARVTLVGNPSWEQGLMTGEAGLIQLVVISNQYDVLGTNQASLRFPTTLFETNSAVSATNVVQWIDVESDHYQLTPGLLSFNDGVTVRQSTNWSARSLQMLAHLNATNREPTKLDALGDFEFFVNQEQGRGQGQADKAEFTLNEEDKWVVFLTGSPRWDSSELSTEARTISVIDPMGAQEVSANGDAILTLSGELLAGMDWFRSGTNTQESAVTKTNLEPVKISSDQYDLNAERVVFKGDVVVSQSTNSLTAPNLTIWFTSDRRAKKLYAERGVTARSGPHTLFAQTLTALFNGPNNEVSEVHALEDVDFRDAQILATGKTLIYQSVTREVVLGGDPIVIASKEETSTKKIRKVRMDAPTITMNLTNKTVEGSAPFTIKTLPIESAEESTAVEQTLL